MTRTALFLKRLLPRRWLLLLLAVAAGSAVPFITARDKKPAIVLPDASKYIQVSNTVKQNMRFLPGGRIWIDTGFMGNITIEGWDRPQVSVTADIMAWGISTEQAMAHIQQIEPVFQREETEIRILSRHPESFQMGRIDYTIKVPGDRTDMKISSVRGFIAITDVNGWIEGDTVIGYLSLIRLSGYVSLKSREGDILVQLEGNRWEGLQISAVTQKGDIRLFMPSDYSTDLTLITEAGAITSDFPDFMQDGSASPVLIRTRDEGQFISQKIRDGGPTVVIQTDNGNIDFRKYERDVEQITPRNPSAHSPDREK